MRPLRRFVFLVLLLPALDALVPAFLPAVPGKPLIYTAADSYIIYNIDPNKLDDGGLLYGHGAMAATGPRGGKSPRDFGIRVPLQTAR